MGIIIRLKQLIGKIYRQKIVGVSLSLYFISLVLPAIEQWPSDLSYGGIYGVEFLLLGWINIAIFASDFPQLVIREGVIQSAAILSWLANPFYWLSIFLVLLKKPISSCISASISLLFAFSYSLANDCYCNPDNLVPDFQFLAGYWFWLLAIIAVVYSSIILAIRNVGYNS